MKTFISWSAIAVTLSVFSLSAPVRAQTDALTPRDFTRSLTVGELQHTYLVHVPKTYDGTRVLRETYAGGKAGSEVVLFLIEGGGHTWPGRDFGPELKVLGRSPRDISANDLIWEFFQKHPMP